MEDSEEKKEYIASGGLRKDWEFGEQAADDLVEELNSHSEDEKKEPKHHNYD